MRITPASVALLILLAAAFPCPSHAGEAREISARIVGVIEGDTIKVITAEGVTERVRLWGVDAPELDQPYGRRARQFVTGSIGATVTIAWETRDRYGRIIGEVLYPSGAELAHLLLDYGLAWWDSTAAPEESVLEQKQAKARESHKGLWFDPASVRRLTTINSRRDALLIPGYVDSNTASE